jgi:PAS domain S-box-containing protein
MSGKSTVGEPGALRRLAEEQVARSGAESSGLPADMARVMHELKVHQVELEMQNEELREARDELEANVELFVELYEFAPVGYFSVSAEGMIRQLNFMGARMLGRERALLIDCSFTHFVSNRRRFDEFLTDLFADKTMEPCEVALLRHGQAPVIVRLTGSPAPDGKVCRIAAMDVTEQRRVEEAAREKNEDLDRIFNLSKDLMGTATMDGRFIRLNPAFQELLGQTQEELKGRGFMDFVHPDDRDATRNAMLDLRAGRDIIDFVNRQLCHDGSYRSLEWRVTPFRGQFICALGRDITERKMAEEALKRAQDELELRVQRRTAQLQERTSQLRALASTLTLAEERERRRIARLIHDHLQQMLVAALLNLGITAIPQTGRGAP